MNSSKHYFICGIGGSGMLPLAVILLGMGHRVSGSDRSYDQGGTPGKFAWLAAQGVGLHAQDGSGISDSLDAVIISKAVEDTVPDIAAAKANNVQIIRRADMLVELFNAGHTRIAVSGTSGKTTTTGMIGFILKEAGLDPTVMNGGIFLNYAQENPYLTAFVGQSGLFVSEIDESDGIETVVRFRPDIAVIHNISLDHQPMDELAAMFSGFLANTRTAVVNADDPLITRMAAGFTGEVRSYGFAEQADLRAMSNRATPIGSVTEIRDGDRKLTLTLNVPGRHNVSNALAALAAVKAAGLDVEEAAEILARFSGIRRRMEIVGAARGVTVMDDFAHNPDKVAATLGTLKEFPGRLIIFFQPHGYGFLKMVGAELAASFSENLGPDDRLYMVEPFYAGGTVDRSVGSQDVIAPIRARGTAADLMPGRDAVREAILSQASAGDRVVIMGARDDSLTDFAREILRALEAA